MKPEAIIVDLDGTLAILNGRDPYDASACEQDDVNQLLLDVIRELVTHWKGLEVIVVTGRQLIDREPTEKWLKSLNVPYSKLFMRPTGYKEITATNLKRLIYENTIKENYSVILAFEDSWRNADMYRELGIPCWQVDKDPSFKK